MRARTRSAFLMLVSISVSLMMTGCGSDRPATDEPGEEQGMSVNPTVYEVAITGTEEEGKFRWNDIPPVELRQGDSVRFVSVSGPAWILIPDGRIEGTSGGRDWARAKDLLAFRLDQEGAVVTVPGDYQIPEDRVEITYSVMAFAEIEGRTGWGYAHGENPPPRMIIRPR